MANQAICLIPNCDKPSRTRTMCNAHYQRWRRHGDASAGKRMVDDGLAQIKRALTDATPAACWMWPYQRSGDGYARITIKRARCLVHRVVCERRHGPPPAVGYEAAHSCGRGGEGCINPFHLDWKSRRADELDKLSHGTHNRGERHGMSKLTKDDVVAIRAEYARGGISQAALGKRYSVSQLTISDITTGKRWGWLT